MRKRLFSLLLIPLFGACGEPGVIAFQEGNDVRWARLENVPSGTAGNVQTVTSLGGWSLRNLTMSPSGGLLALGLRNDNSPSGGFFDTKVLVVNVYTDTQLAEWSEEDLLTFVNDNWEANFPADVVDFDVRNLSWMDDQQLLINGRPVSNDPGEALQDVAMVIRPEDGAFLQGPDFYAGTSPIMAPTHPQKTRYPAENRSGEIFVDGSRVRGLPAGVGLFDFVYLGP